MPPSQPPPDEYFRVICNNVPKGQLGDVMSALTKLGLNDVGFDLVTDIVTFKSRKKHATKAEDFLRQWVTDTKPESFKARDVVAAFEADGRTAGAAYTALRFLCEKNAIQRLGEGAYAPVLALTGPAKRTYPASNPQPRKEYKSSHTEFALAQADGGKLNRADLTKAFKKAKRPISVVSSSIKRLITQGKIERVSEGVYSVLKPRSNGAAHG